MQRCFNENPQLVQNSQGRLVPAYGTSDPLTQDFSDIMNFLGSIPKGVDPNKDAWDVVFERFKEYWNLDIENPYTSPRAIDWFFHEMERQDDGMTDVWSKSDIEKMWRAAMM